MSVIGLDSDVAVIKRASIIPDVEGNPTGGLSIVFTGVGFLGSPRVASQVTDTIAAILAIELPSPDTIRKGDIVECRNQRFSVAFISDVRSHYRLFLERK